MLLAVAALLQPRPGAERVERGAVRRAFADPAFVAGLWLNALPALFFGVLDVLAPLALDAGGYGVVAIGAVFLVAGLIETALNPLLGRLSDRRGRLLPIRWALGASIVVGILLAFAETPAAIAVLAIAGAVSFGGFYTPGIALVSDRAEVAALAQGLGVRRHEHRLGGRRAGRADARRRARRPARRRGAVPPLLVPLRGHARHDQRARAVAAAAPPASSSVGSSAARETARAPRRRRAAGGGSPRRRRARSSACADPSAAATRRGRSGCGVDQGVDLVERPPLDRRRPGGRERVVVEARRDELARAASPSRRSCSAVCSAIVRSRTMYGSGPPSAER